MANLWYVRKAGQVQGPFPAGALVQERLLGRLNPDDLVSTDGESWLPFDAWPQLVEALRALENSPAMDPQPGWNSERARARVRWADQRTRSERRNAEAVAKEAALAAEQRHATGDRRSAEGTPVGTRKWQRSRGRGLFGTEYPIWKVVVGLLILAAVTGLMIWLFGPVNPIRVRIL